MALNGNNGTNGNANVKSYTYNPSTSNWILSAPNYYVDLNAAFIIQDMLDNGVILVYCSDGTGGWLSLPLTAYFPTFFRVTSFHVTLGKVTIWVKDSDLTQTPNPNNQTYRVIAIQGTAGKSLTPQGLNLSNYSEVCKYYNIKE